MSDSFKSEEVESQLSARGEAKLGDECWIDANCKGNLKCKGGVDKFGDSQKTCS